MARELIGLERGREYVGGGDLAQKSGIQEKTEGLNDIWEIWEHRREQEEGEPRTWKGKK